MSVTINGKELHGWKAGIASLALLTFIGLAFAVIATALLSPALLLAFLASLAV